VKSNIGHTGAAAGVAGVIKMVMAMRHDLLPKSLHIDEPTPHVDWSSGSVELLTEPIPWPRNGHPRRAGISSFGVSGTNAHVIIEETTLEEATEHEAEEQTDPAPTTQTADAADPTHLAAVPWVLSARTGDALREQARRLAEYVRADEDLSAIDVGYTLATSRAALESRAVVVGLDRSELLSGLDAVALGEGAANTVLTAASGSTTGRLALLFTGQGSQRLGMGRELYAAYPVFAQAFDAAADELDARLAGHAQRPLAEVVFGQDDATAALLDQTLYTQTGLFALQVALFRLYESWGVEPGFLLGHSIGELAAAHVAGVWSLSDAAALVAARATLMQQLAAGGAMAAIAASEVEIRDALQDRADVSLAAVNGPSAVVVSGDPAAVLEIFGHFEAQGRKVKNLRVSHAFHSSHMDGMLDEFRSVAQGIKALPPRIPVVSNLTGRVATAEELASPDYWVRHVRETVRFADGIATAAAAGATTFVELGPDGVLTALAQDCLAASRTTSVFVPAVRRNRSELVTATQALAICQLAADGSGWERVFAGTEARRVDLPTYAFQRSRYWLDAGNGPADAAGLGLSPADHPLLGAAVQLAGTDALVLTGRLSQRTHPWLADHAVSGTVLLPGTAFVELAVQAGDRVACPGLDELMIEAPLVIPADGAVQIQVEVGAVDAAGRRRVEVFARREEDDALEGGWTRHASGTLSAQNADGQQTPLGLDAWPPAGAVALDLADFYPDLAAGGFGYGPAFQGMRAAWRLDGDIFAEVALPADHAPEAAGFLVHPALFDSALHACGFSGLGQDTGEARLVFSWAGVSIHAAGAAALRVRISVSGPDSVTLEAADATGRPVLSVRELVMRPASATSTGDAGSAADSEQSLYALEWKPLTQDAASAPSAGGEWAVLGTDTYGILGTLGRAGISAREYEDVTSLAQATLAPEVVFLPLSGSGESALPTSALRSVDRMLHTVQGWLAHPAWESTTLVVLTSSAVAAREDEDIADLADASVWGMIRAVQSEHPGRFVLLDSDQHPDSLGALPGAVSAALAEGESQLALREGAVLVPRFAKAGNGPAAAPEGPWLLDTTSAGDLDHLAPLPYPPAARALEPHEIRLAVRASGLNFRDVLVGLGMVPGQSGMGTEGAGVVIETGSAVRTLKVGDRVMGVVPASLGPIAVADHRAVVPIPPSWSFSDAAAMPIAYLTAYTALVDLAGLKPGEKVLIHAAAGGVGMAAVQLARHLGAEVYGTASPGKWDTLRELGLDDAHIASSRSLDFEQRIREATGGRGVDIVLNSLARDYVDASLRLLAEGGRLIEIGKTDLRSPERMAVLYPGTIYQPFIDALPARIGEILTVIVDLMENGGRLRPLPVRCWDIRHAPRAYRYMSQAKHIGKIVLTFPHDLDPNGTVLIAGGTGALGGLLARHLVAGRGARHLLLTSRTGEAAAGAAELRAQLTELGAESVEIAACDVADRAQLADVLGRVPVEHPLTAVVHTAGVVEDGVVTSMSSEQLRKVLRPKVDGAMNLHRLTADADLSMFVLYSSVAGITGGAGQANYAAANAFLDALAVHRRATGLAGTALAWGFWQQASAITGHLGEADRARMERSGMLALSDVQGLALFDAASGRPDAHLIPVRIDQRAASGQGASGAVPAVLRGLSRPGARRAAQSAAEPASPDLLRQLGAAAEPGQRREILTDLVRTHAATVLGLAGGGAIDPLRGFTDIGFDSLTAVELRNRLDAATDLRLPATLIFDYPTPDALAEYLYAELAADAGAAAVPSVLDELDRLEQRLSGADLEASDDYDRAAVTARLEKLLASWKRRQPEPAGAADQLREATADEVFDFIDRELGIAERPAVPFGPEAG
jgi:acyl transferase domain-containing protein/NADPH:quinone reductase-like Zn-dependent oxidoreductase/acyl carrier protein